MVDGWTSSDGCVPVIGISLGNMLVSTVKERTEKHTSELLCKVITNAIGGIENEMGCKVTALCTDGASNMEGMCSMVQRLRPRMLQYQSMAHLLHLLVSDFLKHAGRSSIVSQVIAVAKSFRQVHVLSGALHKMKVRRPPMPCETRWGSIQQTLLWYNRN